MLEIVTSYVAQDAPQVDGRRAITEIHVDGNGGQCPINWMAEADDDVQAAMTRHALDLNAYFAATVAEDGV